MKSSSASVLHKYLIENTNEITIILSSQLIKLNNQIIKKHVNCPVMEAVDPFDRAGTRLPD
jgi:hypothetical protein